MGPGVHYPIFLGKGILTLSEVFPLCMEREEWKSGVPCASGRCYDDHSFCMLGKHMLKNDPGLAGVGTAKALNKQTNKQPLAWRGVLQWWAIWVLAQPQWHVNLRLVSQLCICLVLLLEQWFSVYLQYQHQRKFKCWVQFVFQPKYKYTFWFGWYPYPNDPYIFGISQP